MDRVRQVCSAALSLRKSSGLRVRLPLASLTVAAADAATLAPFADILRDEVNVKDVVADRRTWRRTAGSRSRSTRAACGPRLGGDTQKVIRAVKAGEWTRRAGRHRRRRRASTLLPGEYHRAARGGRRRRARRRCPATPGLVVLDTAVTPELAAEGIARDVVRVVQQARRDAGLDVSDRIALTVRGAGRGASTRCARTRRSWRGRPWRRRCPTAPAAGFTGTVGDGVPVTVGVAKV